MSFEYIYFYIFTYKNINYKNVLNKIKLFYIFIISYCIFNLLKYILN